MIRSVAFGSSSSSTDPVDREVCIREVINAAGRARESPALDCRVGKLANKLYMSEFPEYVFPKKTIWCNGQSIEANSWLSSQRPYIEQALAQL